MALTSSADAPALRLPPASRSDVESLRREVERLEGLVERQHGAAQDILRTIQILPDVVFKCVKRDDGKIVFVFNEGALAREFHVTTGEIQGKTFDEMFPPEFVRLNLPHFERAFAGETAEFVSEIGGRFFRHYPTPARGPDGRVEAVVGFIAEVTEVKRAEARVTALHDQLQERVAELAAANQRLGDADRARAQLVSSVSHELNTALTPMRVQTHLLSGARLGDLNERQRSAVDVLARNTERLGFLVEDLFDAARLQMGRLTLRTGPVDLGRVIVESVESFQESADRSGITLHVELSPDLNVEADARRMAQVLFNLLSNALKFTPTGGTVTVSTETAEGMASVRVRDTGAGLRPEDIGRLFQPFSQVHDTAKGIAGTGLGLYICKGIVEQQGGHISAESDGPGHGTTFVFTVPYARGAPEHAGDQVQPLAPRP